MLKKNFTLVFFILLISDFLLSGQQKFDLQWLEQPHKFISELESCFEYSEIESYQPDESIYICFLKNGYAQANFENPKKWITNVANRRVLEVTVVFSKYPYFKDDWITNYYALLSRRLAMLFRLDPTLNSSKIKWKLLVQTNCKTEEDAQKLLHGIEIRSEYFSLDEKEIHKTTAKSDNQSTKNKPDSLLYQQSKQPVDEEQYWDHFYNQEDKWQQSNDDYQKQFQKKKKRKKRKEPKCPDFSKKKKHWIF
ncbi:MAG: hypothetical protein K9H64_11625 [Bacteroidales bacterium]|nr:hypothetical protein [Bacteroidales bacterium]MCF8456641.1 hypothetical protein [Bacteroidales bacterium]